MMKNLRLIVLGLLLVNGFATVAQKTISEGTLTYDILIQPKSNSPKSNGGLNGATATFFLKGNLSRSDMASSLGTETTLYNGKTSEGVILKEYSGQKLMITLTKENWAAKNKKFNGIVFENAAETKVIEGYNCKRAFAKLNDGSSISVFYTPDLIAMNKEYNQSFKNLPGLPLEYEFETEKLIFRYHISKIDFSPLPAAKFDFPKFGYRIMTYDENKSGKGVEQ